MTVDEAIKRMRQRWAHAPLDERDVRERVATRLADSDELEVLVVAGVGLRIFVRGEGLDHTGRQRYRSRYVHALEDVDAILDALLAPVAEERAA